MGELVHFSSVEALMRVVQRRIFAAASYDDLAAIRAEVLAWPGLSSDAVVALNTLADFREREIDGAAHDAREREMVEAYRAVLGEDLTRERSA